jgi:predicted small integral membrane protein
VLWFVVRMYVGTEWFLAGWNSQCESDTGNAWLVPGALQESLRLDWL